MNEDMVERVARAIANCETEGDWDDLSPHLQAQFRKEARAAIEVMHDLDMNAENTKVLRGSKP